MTARVAGRTVGRRHPISISCPACGAAAQRKCRRKNPSTGQYPTADEFSAPVGYYHEARKNRAARLA